MRFGKRKAPNGESLKALESAKADLEKVLSRDSEVHDLAQSLRDIRKRNHFADQVYVIMSNTLDGRAK